MAETKVYTIPLRREFQKVAFKKRSNKAVKAVKEFVLKHTKADIAVVGEELNEKIWSNGITNPPAKVQVEITKDVVKKDNKDITEAFVNLVGFKRTIVEQKKKGVIQKDAPTGLQGKLKEAVETIKGDDKKETPKVDTKKDSPAKEAPKADAKPVAKTPAATKKAPAKKEAAKSAPKTKDTKE